MFDQRGLSEHNLTASLPQTNGTNNRSIKSKIVLIPSKTGAWAQKGYLYKMPPYYFLLFVHLVPVCVVKKRSDYIVRSDYVGDFLQELHMTHVSYVGVMSPIMYKSYI